MRREEKLLKILQSHHVTEKTMRDQGNNTFTFRVLPSATKHTVASAVEMVYKVKVAGVRILNYKPIRKRNMRGQVGTVSAYKKAMVKLADGQTIDPNASILDGGKA